MRITLILLCLLLLSVTIQAQENGVFGKWKTIDDNTGETKSIVEIYERNGRVFGKIASIFDPEHRDRLCTICKGDDYNKPLIGLEIIKNLKKDGEEFEDGTIFDPENGKEYKAKIWLDEDDPTKLNVRGYIAFFFRTQQWVRA